MHSHRAFWLIALACVFAFAVSAADVSGKWTAQVPGRGGETRETTFTFQVDGEKLAGAVSGPQGDRPISEGKVSGDEISFVVPGAGGGGNFKMVYKGKVAGDQIHFTVHREGGQGGGRSREFTAKKM